MIPACHAHIYVHFTVLLTGKLRTASLFTDQMLAEDFLTGDDIFSKGNILRYEVPFLQIQDGACGLELLECSMQLAEVVFGLFRVHDNVNKAFLFIFLTCQVIQKSFECATSFFRPDGRQILYKTGTLAYTNMHSLDQSFLNQSIPGFLFWTVNIPKSSK